MRYIEHRFSININATATRVYIRADNYTTIAREKSVYPEIGTARIRKKFLPSRYFARYESYLILESEMSFVDRVFSVREKEGKYYERISRND